MKCLVPFTVTPAMVVAASIPESNYPAWSAVTTYAASTPGTPVRVAKGHKDWESVAAGNLNHDPEADDGTWWIEVGPSNLLAMFDEVPSTVMQASASSVSVTLAPGQWVTDIALVAFAGTSARVQVFEADGTTLLQEQTKPLPGIPGPSFYDWFFRDAVALTGSIVFSGLPRRLTGRIVVTLYGPGSVSLGVLALGTAHDLGTTLVDVSTSIKDYSGINTDEFGTVSITRRKRVKKLRYPMQLLNRDVPRVLALRDHVSATMCVFFEDGASDALSDAMLAYGFFNDFPLLIKGPTYSTYTLEVQGA